MCLVCKHMDQMISMLPLWKSEFHKLMERGDHSAIHWPSNGNYKTAYTEVLKENLSWNTKYIMSFLKLISHLRQRMQPNQRQQAGKIQKGDYVVVKHHPVQLIQVGRWKVGDSSFFKKQFAYQQLSQEGMVGARQK